MSEKLQRLDLGYIEGLPRRERTAEELISGNTVSYPRKFLYERLDRLARIRETYDLNDLGIKMVDHALLATVSELNALGEHNLKPLRRFGRVESR